MKVRELGQNPISKDKPAGDDAHYEPEFEELQQEIDKLSIASATGDSTDWKRVTSLCVTILSEKSKDLLVAAYLATGLTKTHGFEGLTVGIAFLKDLIATFWEDLFPPKRRMRGRMNAITWWQERMVDFIKSLSDSDPLPPDQVEAVKKSLEELDQTLAEKYDDAPSMREMMTYLDLIPVVETQQPEPEPTAADETPEEFQHKEPAPQPAAAEQSQPSQQPQPTRQAPPAAPLAGQAAQSQKEADDAMAAAMGQLLTVADFYLQNTPGSALSYRLRRIASWLPLSAPPPATNGQTMIPPPEDSVKDPIEKLLESGNNEGVLKASESRIAQFRFWLDLTRLTASALQNLGGAYKDAYDAVCAETLLLIQRLKGVENLAFSDGTPFADQETRAWLKTLGLGTGEGGGASGDETQEAVDQAFQDARQMLKDKKAIAAVECMSQGLSSAGSGRARILWRLGATRVLLLAARPELAAASVEQALAEMDAHRLEEFAPELAVKALTLGVQAYGAQEGEESVARAREMLTRLARINPAEALRLSGTK